MLLRRATAASVAAASVRIAATRIARSSTAPLQMMQMRAASKMAAANAAAAATAAAAPHVHGREVAPTLPTLPPTQLTYLSGASLTTGNRADLQAVAVFLTEDELALTLAAARSSSGATATGEHAPISMSALLASASEGATPEGGLFDGAVTHAQDSHVWCDFAAKAGETLWLYPTASAAASTGKKAAAARNYPRVLLIGLGAASKVQLSTYRSATWRAVSTFQSASLLGRVGVVLPLPPVVSRYFNTHAHAEISNTVARIAALSNHTFRKHLSAESLKSRKKAPIQEIDLIDFAPLNAGRARTASKGRGKAASSTSSSSSKSSPASSSTSPDRSDLVRTQSIIATATILAREWANERGDIATPLFMEQQARLLAAKYGLGIRVLQDEDLANEGLELIRAVGRGATHKARLVVLEYRGDGAAKTSTSKSSKGAAAASASVDGANFTALVGKGVTFDTGGLLIKGRGSMENMHLDMSGSAVVLSVMQALPQLQYSGNVVGVLALAENAVDAESFKPLAILPSVKGSVEVMDTDAEGRLVLADALTYVQRHFKPTRIVDLATLTGASVVALGENRAALFANDPELEEAATVGGVTPMGSANGQAMDGSLASQLCAAGERVGERLWRMPIDDTHRDEIKGSQADIRNTGTTRYGGACTAAAFLEKFIDKGVSWAHIDLAGPAMRSKPTEWVCEGGTGFGSQLLIDHFQQQQLTESENSAVEQMRAALSNFTVSDLGQQQE